MPTYDYRCRACGHGLERFQKMSDPPLRRCPECGKRQLERLIGSGGGLVFRGPGFYATDYRAPPPKPEGDSGAKPSKPAKPEKPEGSAGRGGSGGGDADA